MTAIAEAPADDILFRAQGGDHDAFAATVAASALD